MISLTVQILFLFLSIPDLLHQCLYVIDIIAYTLFLFHVSVPRHHHALEDVFFPGQIHPEEFLHRTTPSDYPRRYPVLYILTGEARHETAVFRTDRMRLDTDVRTYSSYYLRQIAALNCDILADDPEPIVAEPFSQVSLTDPGLQHETFE